jgi:hypothetical protein
MLELTAPRMLISGCAYEQRERRPRRAFGGLCEDTKVSKWFASGINGNGCVVPVACIIQRMSSKRYILPVLSGMI